MPYLPHAIAVFMAFLLGSAADENRMLKDENNQLSARVEALRGASPPLVEGVSCKRDESPDEGDIFLARAVEFSPTPSFK